MNIRDAIRMVVAGQHLEQDAAAAVMEAIMEGAASPAQIAAFLTALHLKGEHESEIAGMAMVMRSKATPVPFAGPLVDTCGTGGDGAGTFNISTTAAFVVAGAGVTVAKHGNRAMSSESGSADLLEALGVKIDMEAAQVARLLRDAGIGFMFAPRFHPAMRHAGPVRREIGIRTVFNVLGPLTNPAGARHQVLGVATPTLAEKLALALGRMDIDHALVVHGAGGLDELSLSGPSLVYDVRPGQPPQRMVVDAAQLGLQPAPNEALRGGNAATNAAITKGVLTGAEQGPRRDVVLLNAAAALVAADAAPDLHTGIEQARASIDGGYAYERLQRMVNLSNFSE
ncbi:MAG: anthranilate phosphoribosyltransferase [Chloroflexaceae bacterium]|nr:anthranilate phosphoribosyltransferase [Chloroflexaceae bacterium]